MSDQTTVAVLIVAIGGNRCGLPLGAVAEVVPSARTERLPGAPASVLGVLNLRSELLVVLDGRRCFGHDDAPVRTTDRFVVLNVEGGRRALRVDAADDIIDIPSNEVTAVSSVMPDVLTSAGIARFSDGLLVIHDPGRLLSAPDTSALQEALARLDSRSAG